MKNRTSLLWAIPTFVTVLSVLGFFSEPWSHTKVGLLTLFLVILAVGYISFLIFFTQIIQFRLHFLHLLVIPAILTVILSIVWSQDLQYSLYGPTAAMVDGGVLMILGLLAVLIIPQLGRSTYILMYRGLEGAITLSALYTLVLQIIPFGQEFLINVWGFLGFQTFPAVLIAPNITTALMIHSIVSVSFLAQGLLEFVKPEKKIIKILYFSIAFLMNFVLMVMFVGEGAPVFAYVINIIGTILLLAILAQKGLLLQRNRITKAAVVLYIVIAVSVVSAMFSPTYRLLQSQFSFITNYTIPVTGGAFKENPIVGSGPGTISMAWNKYYPIEFNNTSSWDEQRFALANEFLDTVVQYGVLGGILFALFVLAAGYFGYITIIKDKLNFSASLQEFNATY